MNFLLALSGTARESASAAVVASAAVLAIRHGLYAYVVTYEILAPAGAYSIAAFVQAALFRLATMRPAAGIAGIGLASVLVVEVSAFAVATTGVVASPVAARDFVAFGSAITGGIQQVRARMRVVASESIGVRDLDGSSGIFELG